jgi:anaerobic dimethyl sulfoxide reductase subunit A
MKRTHWEPGGGDKSLRGKDTWERISWEEALDYVANELKKAKENYGNKSILLPYWGTSIFGNMCRLLGTFGGYTEVADSASFGSFSFNVGTIGLPPMASNKANDRISMRKSDFVVLYGCNPGWSSGGNPAYWFLAAKKAGAQFVFVGPEYNVTAAVLEAKWIRLRPGTDTAFLLAVAYEMIKADEATPGAVLDKDFLDTYTVGFDAEHMPEDATLEENFQDYVLGAYDNTPKTAEWAAEITGTPVEDIKWYAETMGKKNKVSILHSFAAARCNNAEDFPQLYYTIGAMGGHFHGEGQATGSCYHSNAGNCGAGMVNAGFGMQPIVANVEGADCFKGPELWQGILDGRYNYTGNYLMGAGADAPSEIRDIDIRVIYHESHAFLQSQIAIPKGIEAHRKVDFVVTQDYVLNTNAKYSDIVLPVTTHWERVDTTHYLSVANREMKFYPSKIMEPLYEAKDDDWIIRELAKRLDIDPDAILPLSSKQVMFTTIAGSTVADAAGKATPLVTITQELIDELGVTGEPQEGIISYDELIEKGVYQLSRSEGDGYEFNGWDAFVADPTANPLSSKSGKFEIYCEEKANIINNMKRSTVKPYPTYVRPLNGYEDSFSDWATKTKGEYPYQITNPHYLRRAHTTLDNIPWLREAMPNPVWINIADAAEKGVTEGDTVLIYNQWGKVLRTASLTERMMPGVVALPHGTWVEMDEETGIDKAGADNVLCAPVASGIGLSGYNTNLVNFEKYDGSALEPDYTWPQRIIEL